MTADYRSDPLWLKLEAMSVNEPRVPVPMTARIGAEANLANAEVEEAVSEYKRYLYVSLVCGVPVVMPLRADKVWRTHITYTHHYRDQMCAELLGRQVHYVSAAALRRQDPDRNWREATDQAYRNVFGRDPPARLHDDLPKRFAPSRALVPWWLIVIAALTAIAFINSRITLATSMIAIFGAAALISHLILLPAIVEWTASRHLAGKRTPLSSEDEDVLAELLKMELEEPGERAEGFIARLERSTGWPIETCRKAVAEYRRFLFVRYKAKHQVTPSPAVDKVWHLHLVQSEHYWNVLCGQILRQPFHHIPANGERGERARFRSQYLRTLAAYEEVLGARPPSDIWPFGPSPQQRRAVWSALAAGTAAVGLHIELDHQSSALMAAVTVPLMVLAATIACSWRDDDEAIALAEFSGNPSRKWEESNGEWGGCGG